MPDLSLEHLVAAIVAAPVVASTGCSDHRGDPNGPAGSGRCG